MNGTSMLVSGIAIFILGAACGARMVYLFRHVTTKALHQTLLNTIKLRTASLDRPTESASQTEVEFVDLEEVDRVDEGDVEDHVDERDPVDAVDQVDGLDRVDHTDFVSKMAATSPAAGATALRVYRGT